jgi:hypothetical protein
MGGSLGYAQMRVLMVGLLLLSACDVFRSNSKRPKSELTPQQFVEVYTALGKARTPAEKQRVLRQHKTSEKALQEFVQAYAQDLPELSAVFDSALARLNAPADSDSSRRRR